MRRRWSSKFASGSTCYARFIRGTQHGDARFATASLPDQHADALQKTCRFNYITQNFEICEGLLTLGKRMAISGPTMEVRPASARLRDHLIVRQPDRPRSGTVVDL